MPQTYSISNFNFGGLGALFVEAKPTKAPPWRQDWTGIFVPEALSIKADKISNAVIAGVQCGWYGTGNTISLLMLHNTIMKQQRPCLV